MNATTPATNLIRVLAIDPALANWGLAKLLFNPATGQIQVEDLKLLATKKEAGKTVRVSSDDLRRCSETYIQAHAWASDASILIAEVPSGSKSSRGSIGNGTAIGMLAALRFIRPLVEVNPIEVKKAVTGRKTASKDEMIQWATKRYPDAPWLKAKTKGVTRFTDANEHLADAVAIAHAGVLTTEFRASVQMFLSASAPLPGGGASL